MATTPKTKKPVTSTKSKGVVASKKKGFSKKQWGIIAVAGMLVLAVGGYFAFQAYENSSPNAASKWTKVAWGTGSNNGKKATVAIYACKIPVSNSTGNVRGRYQVRTKTIVTSSKGNPTISAFLDVRKDSTDKDITTSANKDKYATFKGTDGATHVLTTSASSTGNPGYAVAGNIIWVEAHVSDYIAASTFNNDGSALSRPLHVSQIAGC